MNTWLTLKAQEEEEEGDEKRENRKSDVYHCSDDAEWWGMDQGSSREPHTDTNTSLHTLALTENCSLSQCTISLLLWESQKERSKMFRLS
ncbi:hypothetical protein SRHO_G00122000 [Serrasalmus rhombeus]